VWFWGGGEGEGGKVSALFKTQQESCSNATVSASFTCIVAGKHSQLQGCSLHGWAQLGHPQAAEGGSLCDVTPYLDLWLEYHTCNHQ